MWKCLVGQKSSTLKLLTTVVAKEISGFKEKPHTLSWDCRKGALKLSGIGYGLTHLDSQDRKLQIHLKDFIYF